MIKNYILNTIIAFLTIMTFSCNSDSFSRVHKNESVIEDQEEEIVQPHLDSMSILIAGDFMQHGPQIHAAARPDSTYNYDECFARVSSVFENADVAIGNFEVTLGGKPYAGYYNMGVVNIQMKCYE